MKTKTSTGLAALVILAASTARCDPSLGIGDPCSPEVEGDETFAGFTEKEVSVESKSRQCRTNLCLVNHFRGRTDLPQGARDESRCVSAQCTDRTVNDAVYCSCRCANANGENDDGSVYCACPDDGFECKQLVARIGSLNEGLTGAYCVKKGTDYDENRTCQSTPDGCLE